MIWAKYIDFQKKSTDQSGLNGGYFLSRPGYRKKTLQNIGTSLRNMSERKFVAQWYAVQGSDTTMMP